MVSQKLHAVLVAVSQRVLHCIFEEERNAAQWCPSHIRKSFGPSPFEPAVDKSADDRVEPFDSLNGRFGQLRC